MTVYVGTSGWQYASWRGVFYPRDVPQRRWLEYYVTRFPTVENNSAFYRLPDRKTFASWRSRTPDGFVTAVKTSRFLTHIRRLADAGEPVRRFVDAASELGDRLGPVLLQLPPTLRAEPDRLAACLDLFPKHMLVAVEPRHDSWWTDDVRTLLAERNATLCWADRRGRPTTPLWRTADWAYLRMHHGTATPPPRYGDQALRSWVRRLTETWPDDAAIYTYFNNDPGGAAIVNAERFTDLMEKAGRTVARPAEG